MKSKLLAYMELMRLYEWRIYFAAIARMLIGAIYARGVMLDVGFISALGSVIFITGGNLSLNDFFDKDIDKLNSPNRPIPSNRISASSAAILSSVLFLNGILLSIYISKISAIIATIGVFFSIIYPILKRRGIAGHMCVGAISATAVLYGGAIMNNISEEVITIAASLFLYFTGVNIITSLKDIKGDHSLGARTLPVMVGPFKAVFFAAPLFIVGILLNVYLVYLRAVSLILIPLLLIFTLWLILEFRAYLIDAEKNAEQLFYNEVDKKWIDTSMRLNFNARAGSLVLILILISANFMLIYSKNWIQ
jgi:geranylgeranylglycerol-phosphate geranylgeranyltransferase